MMRRILTCATTMALTAATAAFAADLPVNAPAMVPAVLAQFSWTGCFVGGHVGGAFRGLTETNNAGASTTQNSSGSVGGGQIGCDYQFASNWVLGLEGQAAWTNLKSSIASPVTIGATGAVLPSQFTVSNDFLASVTGRIGYSFFDRRGLVYFRGGVAWTNERADDAFTTPQGNALDPSTSGILTGLALGTGVEWAFTPSWSARLEFDAYGFANRALTLTAPNVTVTTSSFSDGLAAITAGVNYRF
jgi:outer membrane immunogenic protein